MLSNSSFANLFLHHSLTSMTTKSHDHVAKQICRPATAERARIVARHLQQKMNSRHLYHPRSGQPLNVNHRFASYPVREVNVAMFSTSLDPVHVMQTMGINDYIRLWLELSSTFADDVSLCIVMCNEYQHNYACCTGNRCPTLHYHAQMATDMTKPVLMPVHAVIASDNRRFKPSQLQETRGKEILLACYAVTTTISVAECYEFRVSGTCGHGASCKFIHISSRMDACALDSNCCDYQTTCFKRHRILPPVGEHHPLMP